MNKRCKMTIPIITTLILAVILNISGMGGAKNNDPVYIFAAEHDLPVWVHSDISSVWIQEPIYLYEMEEAVERVLSPLQAFLGKKSNIK